MTTKKQSIKIRYMKGNAQNSEYEEKVLVGSKIGYRVEGNMLIVWKSDLDESVTYGVPIADVIFMEQTSSRIKAQQ
ncbi:MAG: hypothetical protein CUN55_00505 [Phototrophicales bacterium]|nr:MAG: hypothetical protein CUN55_00505 [Phototrophicales bacterium]